MFSACVFSEFSCAIMSLKLLLNAWVRRLRLVLVISMLCLTLLPWVRAVCPFSLVTFLSFLLSLICRVRMASRELPRLCGVECLSLS